MKISQFCAGGVMLEAYYRCLSQGREDPLLLRFHQVRTMVRGSILLVVIFPCASVAIQGFLFTFHYSRYTSRNQHHVPTLQDDVLLQVFPFLDIAIAEGYRGQFAVGAAQD